MRHLLLFWEDTNHLPKRTKVVYCYHAAVSIPISFASVYKVVAQQVFIMTNRNCKSQLHL
jgi:hypothetical protein